MNHYLKQTIRLVSLVFFPVVTFGSYTPATAQVFERDFDDCAATLLEREVSPELAAVACAQAYRPEELSDCVAQIASRTAIAPESAVTACIGVRRPENLANCVTEISSDEQTAALALDTCRRSLLPERFAECVTGLSETIPDLSTTEAMTTCIGAEFSPVVYSPVE